MTLQQLPYGFPYMRKILFTFLSVFKTSIFIKKIVVDWSFSELAYFFEGLPPERESPLHQVLQGLSPGDLLLAQHTLHHIRYSYRFGRQGRW
jgi:hypothetical protein